jgi:hypothetical protein
MRMERPSGARVAALLTAAAFAGPPFAPCAFGQEEGPFGDPDLRQEQLEPSPSLPQSFNGVIRPRNGEEAPARPAAVNTLRDVVTAIRTCWQPSGAPFSGQEITILVSFKRNGEVLGKPRITHYKAGRSGENRNDFSQAVSDAFARCSPLPFSPTLGAAVAGRPFTFRFIDAPAPKSQSL